MKTIMKTLGLAFTCAALLFTAPMASAQGNGKGQEKKEYKKEHKEAYKNGSAYKEKGKGHGKVKAKGNGKNKHVAGNFPHSKPQSFKVPPGHYPPAGMYRIWYPGRPPGHQPQPVHYGQPANAPITDGAFIIHGNRAYDTQYDWRKEEAKQPQSVPRDIIDILFPNARNLPAQVPPVPAQ